MTLPTAEEIRAVFETAAFDDATAGPSSDGFVKLVLRDPTLRSVADRMAGTRPMLEGRLSHVLAAAIAVGLNYGLRIGEQRRAANEHDGSFFVCMTHGEYAQFKQLMGQATPSPDTPETAAEKARGAADWGAKFEAMGRPDRER